MSTVFYKESNQEIPDSNRLEFFMCKVFTCYFHNKADFSCQNAFLVQFISIIDGCLRILHLEENMRQKLQFV